MKPVTIRVEDSTIAAAEKLYGAKVTGCQIAAAAYFELQRRELESLKGKFTPAELSAIVDNYNGTMRDPRFMCDGRILEIHLLDGQLYENLLDHWNVNQNHFLIKVRDLTPAQCYFLLDAVHRFWESDNPVLEEFLNSLA